MARAAWNLIIFLFNSLTYETTKIQVNAIKDCTFCCLHAYKHDVKTNQRQKLVRSLKYWHYFG